ncbi:transcriptional regulator [[Haemophilus] ducreyi]|nr:Mor transcription activator family protein [[Haemophilus] ducreyi]AKO30289.1 transcriptional regulator [[Haemophilus] ducreyi]AKO31722.1 transcriptional regulator [[Haemophilus] ducreyi]AKO33175.1 transcriptional regulator [[Haemophilus] ducreyi]AKO34624.1 transcriptional regulator [[Haemophilus] ducreyi]AKO36055.1 transcriptional regulator [[Haemophilus] ducreyi]
MTDNQHDLFADDHAAIGELFDNLDNIPDGELAEAWSSVLTISHYLGGRAIYLPRGDRLKEALRDYAIYDEFDGKNVQQLSERYGLCVPQIYAIIRKQRKLIRSRHQPELPY